jgi:hypothetical protein
MSSVASTVPVVIPCKTVDELWSRLDPTCPLGGLAGNPSNLVFRGQADSTWGLTPSVCRELRGLRRSPTQLVFKRDTLTTDQQVVAELRLLQLFVEACDLCALPLPIDSSSFREKWILENSQGLNDASRDPGTWPPKDVFDLLAIAQHHGVPTRLLDWTRRSHVAAYFAAEGGLDREDAEDRSVAVWVLDLERRGLFREVEVVRVPGATSKNLAAQEGLFTLVRGAGARGQPYVPSHIEDVLAAKFAHNPTACPLWKLTLPRSEAPRLLDRCAKFGVSGATLFPGYDGAAKSALNRVLA